MRDTPPGTAADEVAANPDELPSDVQAIPALPGPSRHVVTGAFNKALHDMFLTAVPLVAVALVVAFFIGEVPLGTRHAGQREETPAPAGPAP